MLDLSTELLCYAETLTDGEHVVHVDLLEGGGNHRAIGFQGKRLRGWFELLKIGRTRDWRFQLIGWRNTKFCC